MSDYIVCNKAYLFLWPRIVKDVIHSPHFCKHYSKSKCVADIEKPVAYLRKLDEVGIIISTLRAYHTECVNNTRRS